MMIPRTLRLALLLVPGAWAASAALEAPAAHPETAVSLPATATVQQVDLEKVLADRARAASSLSEEEFWQEVSTLSDLARQAGAETADRALDALLAKPAELGERGTLLLAATRFASEDADLDPIAATLGELLKSKDGEVARGAAGMLADARFAELDADRVDALLESLVAGAKDAERDPETRMDFAVAAWVRGASPEKLVARDEMQAFLASSDPHLRELAALSLARVGDVETPREELERVAKLPGPEGQLAASFLKADWQREYYESKLRKQRERMQSELEDQAPAQDLAQIDRLIRLIQTRHIEGDSVKRDQLLDAAMDGMLQSLDTHSSYLPSAVFDKFEQDLEGEYGGIGAYVQEDPNDNLFTITRPIYSGPAYKANLRSDDKVVQIDDWPTIENGRSKETDDIITRLKGKPGTTVKLYIWRRGMDPGLITRPTEDMAVEITRELITVPPMRADVLPGGVGLIELSTFSGVAGQELGAVMKQMVKAGVTGVILDLRNNAGGLLEQAQAVADLFLPKGKLIVTTEERVRPPVKLYSEHDPVIPENMPVAVLVNRFSASASEIVAGALQDHGRAVLVGERSYGKGSVQNLVPLGLDDDFDDENGNHRHDNWEKLTRDWNGNGKFDFAPRAKLTIARWLIPSGRSIHRELDDEGRIVSLGGVQPDFDVAARRWDGWRLEEMRKLVRDRKVREWVLQQWPKEKELLTQLADNDGKDPSRYPGFEEFYQSLGTVLPEDDVRYLVRSEVRRLVQDERGSAFPEGDYQEDLQLQKAIQIVLDKLGHSASEYLPYASTFEDLTTGSSGDRLVSAAEPGVSPEGRREVRDALAILARAKGENGELSQESLDRLHDLLIKLDH